MLVRRETFDKLAQIAGTKEQQAVTNREQLAAEIKACIIDEIIQQMFLNSKEEMRWEREQESRLAYQQICREKLVEAELAYYRTQLSTESTVEQNINNNTDIQSLQITLEKLEQEKAIIDEKYEQAEETWQQADKEFKQAANNINNRRKSAFASLLEELDALIAERNDPVQNSNPQTTQNDDDNFFRTKYDIYQPDDDDEEEDDLVTRRNIVNRHANMDVGRLSELTGRDINENHLAANDALVNVIAKLGRGIVNITTQESLKSKVQSIVDETYDQSIEANKADCDTMKEKKKVRKNANTEKKLLAGQREQKQEEITVCEEKINVLQKSHANSGGF